MCHNLRTLADVQKEFLNYKIIHYVNSREIYIQTDYGIHKYYVQDLRDGHKPKIQTAIDKSQYYINKHNDVNYPVVNLNYKSQYSILTASCKEHGYFKVSAKSYKKGVRCKKCANRNKGWSNKKYDKNFNRSCNFYLINLTNDSESFYKVGITNKKVKYRYSNLKDYNYKLLYQRKTNYVSALHLEANFIKYHKKYRYEPKIKFHGYTECFSEIKIFKP